MPRYAEGSAEKYDYDLLLELSELSDRTSTLNQKFGSGNPSVGAAERIQAVRSIIRCNQMGWVDDDTALSIVHDITQGVSYDGFN